MSERAAWFKWYPSDWRGDDNVKGCSLAARGLWRECLDIMHNAPQRGYLVGQNGPLSDADLALYVGRPIKEVRAALIEIENQKVSSRTNDGILFSRRMVKDTRRSEKFSEWGSLGGNPELKPEVKPSLNSQVKPRDIPARAQTRTLSSESSSTSKEESDLLAARFETFWEAYPRKESKKDALRAFGKITLTPEVFAAILDGIRRFKLTDQWKDIRYIPHAASWLNQERWKDEVLTTAPSTKKPADIESRPHYPTTAEVVAKRDADFYAGGGKASPEEIARILATRRPGSVQ